MPHAWPRSHKHANPLCILSSPACISAPIKGKVHHKLPWQVRFASQMLTIDRSAAYCRRSVQSSSNKGDRSYVVQGVTFIVMNAAQSTGDSKAGVEGKDGEGDAPEEGKMSTWAYRVKMEAKLAEFAAAVNEHRTPVSAAEDNV